MSTEIIVTGQRLSNNTSMDSVSVVDATYLMQVVSNDSTWAGSLPGVIRDLFNVEGEITTDGFDSHHKDLIKLAIAKLASIPEFKAAFDSQKSQSVNVSIVKTDNLIGVDGITNVTNPYEILVMAPQNKPWGLSK